MAEMTAMQRFMAANAEKWNDTATKINENPNAFDRLPDGLYVSLLSGMEVAESKAGNLMLVTTYTILEGDYEGESVKDYLGLEKEDSLKNLARRIKGLGYDPAEIDLSQEDALEQWCEEVQEAEHTVKIRLKTNREGTFQNAYLEKLLDDEVEGHNASVAAQAKAAAPAPAPTPTPAPKAKPGPKPKGAVAPAPAPAAKKKEPAPPPPPAPPAEPEGEGDDEEEVDLSVGMRVSFTVDGAEKTGVVVSINDEAESAVVKVGLRKYTVTFDNMEVVDGETDG